MKYTVDLQPAAWDRLFWFLITLFILAAGIFFFSVLIGIIRKAHAMRIARMKELKKKVGLKKVPESIEALRQKAFEKLKFIENEQMQGRMKPREACIGISAVVREFLSKAGGLNADCQTLSEIRQWNRPEVAEFVEEIYSAEFSLLSVKDTRKYFEDAGRLVMIWR
ncbi:MAG: hypothetical protein J6X66_13685 [Lachnospiraceae bacterium]|nr:hypothetical protein [Lachnospiraceae bacterium]